MAQPVEGEDVLVDPLADLMIGVAALFLAAAVVIAPAVARGVTGGSTMPETTVWQLDGQIVRPFIATRDGVVLPDRRFVPLAEAAKTPVLPAALAAIDRLLLVVEPGAEDAAFFVEALAARAGRTDIAIVRRGVLR